MQLSKALVSIERFAINADWKQCFPHAKVNILPKLKSDHSPVLVKVVSAATAYFHHVFQFQAAWVSHSELQDPIQANWDNNLPLGENKERLEGFLSHWHKTCFGGIRPVSAV